MDINALHIDKDYFIVEMRNGGRKYLYMHQRGCNQTKAIIFDNTNKCGSSYTSSLGANYGFRREIKPNIKVLPYIVVRHGRVLKVDSQGRTYYVCSSPFAIYDANYQALTTTAEEDICFVGYVILPDASVVVKASMYQRNINILYHLKNGNLKRLIIGKHRYTVPDKHFSLYIYKDKWTKVPTDSLSQDVATYHGVERVRCLDLKRKIVDVSPEGYLQYTDRYHSPLCLTVGGKIIELAGEALHPETYLN